VIDNRPHFLNIFWKEMKKTQELPLPSDIEDEVILGQFTLGADNIAVPMLSQTSAGGVASNDIKNVLQPKLKFQGLGLPDGYEAFQTEYGDGNSIFGSLVHAEKVYLQTMNAVTDARDYYDTVSQVIGGFSNAISADFGQLLTAYRAAEYYDGNGRVHRHIRL
jgi:hypothetical protein